MNYLIAFLIWLCAASLEFLVLLVNYLRAPNKAEWKNVAEDGVTNSDSLRIAFLHSIFYALIIIILLWIGIKN